MSDEPDAPFRFAINPAVMERNARNLVGILAQFFPADGGTSDDLRIKFEQVTGLRRQIYYDTLGYAKYKRWIVGGGKNKLYQLNPDRSWKPIKTSDGEILERDRLEYLADTRAQQIGELQDEVERLRDWTGGGDANGANNVALSNLIKIVADNSASPRQRLRAAAAVLSYKTPDDITNFVRKYLESLCGSDEATDYKIEAGELLRKHEAPRVTPGTVRPNYEADGAEADRIAAWRHDAKMQRRYEIAMETGNTPPPGWSDEIDSAAFVAPPGWPPKIRLPSSS